MRSILTATFLLGFTQLAMGQCAPQDQLMIRISADGICHFVDTATPCTDLGSQLKALRLGKGGIHFDVDDGVKQEVVEAAHESLKRAGFTKIGCVSNEIV